MTSEEVARILLDAASSGDDPYALRAILHHLAAKWPDDGNADVISRQIQKKIDRLQQSN